MKSLIIGFCVVFGFIGLVAVAPNWLRISVSILGAIVCCGAVGDIILGCLDTNEKEGHEHRGGFYK